MIGLIDLGGTAIKYGVFNPDQAAIQGLKTLPTLAQAEDFDAMERLSVVIEDLQKSYDLSGLAISSAGLIHPLTGEVLFANENLPHYMGTQVKEELEARYDLPVSVLNDVRSALLGELTFGDYPEVDSALMLTVGTGVGGALWLNGQLYHGSSLSAGEVGYSISQGRSIEDLASTRAMVRQVKAALPQTLHSQIDGRWIFEQAQAGDEICQEAIQSLVDHLMEFVIAWVSLINPQLVIFGGGIMEQTEYLAPLLQESFDRSYTNEYVKDKTQLCFAQLGNQAGMLGAYQHFVLLGEE